MVEIEVSRPVEMYHKPIEVTPREEIKVERKGCGYINFPKLDITMDDLYSDFKESHKRYKLLVEEVCENWDISTNNDLILYLEVLRTLGLCEITLGKENFVIKIKREDLKKLPASESISRARRSLNAKNLCLPTDVRIFKMRAKREVACRKYFSQEKFL